jgi:hypothetical protein
MKSFSLAGAALMLVAGASLGTAEAQTNPPAYWDTSQVAAQPVQQGAVAATPRPPGTNINTTMAGRRVILAGSRRAIPLSDV